MTDGSADNAVSKPIQKLQDDLLPAVYRAGSQHINFVAPGSNLAAYLEEEFSPQKFANLGQYIWMAGRPYPARPLSIQRVLGRQIVPTNDISLHLVWTTGKIFVKPLPRFLLTDEFYEDHLSNVSDPKIHRLNRQLLGFLWSYVALLPTELDFRIACKQDLIVTDQEVPTADWQRWRGVVKQVLTHYKTDRLPSTSDHDRAYVYDLIPQRYKYGELRLSRLDKISRIQGHVHHGWSSLTGTTRYNDWVVKYFTPIAASVAYLVVLLSALQVGLATEKLNQSWTFQNVSVGFTLLALVTLVVAIGSGVLLLLGMFILNWIKSAIISKSSNKQQQAED